MKKNTKITTNFDGELAEVLERFAHTKQTEAASAFGRYSNGERRSEQAANGRHRQQTILASVTSALKNN